MSGRPGTYWAKPLEEKSIEVAVSCLGVVE